MDILWAIVGNKDAIPSHNPHSTTNERTSNKSNIKMLPIPVWIKLAAFISGLSAVANSARPLLAREFLLKYSIRLNKYEFRSDIPSQCPSRYDMRSRVGTVDYDRYQGLWYSFATNDPTQPSGLCRCDRFNWKYNEAESSFISELDIKCAGLGIFRMELEGETNVTGVPGIITEGSPSFGANKIPGYILWVADDYSATIRYFCEEEYLGVPVFSSLQIWTREPIKRNSEQGMALMQKAHDLISFDDVYLDFADHSTDCKELPRIRQ